MLLELCTRFVLNCPTEELKSEERIMFLVEEARALRNGAASRTASLTPSGRRTGSMRTSAEPLRRGSS
jgi:Dcp2, box A domain